ncbi:class I SAM-dependent DNA methyltransferase [Ottowia beijingensis]|uniref:site-specific DNA-methyltransferase (adenine-specific) n=1 Tax=Ottowia beijingensis TaxID=1207057 RepID=A0A853IYR0_9BURK|nr:class I SAM-dependent DNA methyltransferase [Ottowia beijingensis]
MTPADFIAKWGPGGPAHSLSERAGAQPHFIDLCRLLGVPEPGAVPGEDYVFEQHTLLLGEARGYADVYWRNRFAWENKAPAKNLDAALRQLQQYSLALSNPPLLVVCDRLVIRIHTQFNGHPSEQHTVRIDQLDQPATQSLLRRVWLDPESFRPQKTTRDITEAAARSFATLAEQLRSRGNDAETVAHFLTQCLFCFFAEDVGLLPGRMFERLVGNRQLTSGRLTTGLQSLFATMQGGGLYGPDDIPWFNGGLFQRIDVPRLEIVDITELRNAAALNWSAIDVSIFGTLFERGLDPAKRSQLGAHYTDPATIARIVEPVVTRPLLQKWELTAQELRAQTAKIKKHGDAAHRKAHARFVLWLEELRAFRILDPACGSGNFLFLGLKALKDVELLTITQAADLGLDREQDLVTGPHNVLGIELNEYAAELARVSIWIGEIQWRIAHGYPPKTNPVLEPLEQIECRDALLQFLPPRWGGPGGARPPSQPPPRPSPPPSPQRGEGASPPPKPLARRQRRHRQPALHWRQEDARRAGRCLYRNAAQDLRRPRARRRRLRLLLVRKSACSACQSSADCCGICSNQLHPRRQEPRRARRHRQEQPHLRCVERRAVGERRRGGAGVVGGVWGGWATGPTERPTI